MTHRCRSLSGILLSLALVTVHGQDSTRESPAPVATPTIQKQLDEATAAAAAGDTAKAVSLADQALAAARKAGDALGDVYALRLLAMQAGKLGRASEAASAWREAETAWQRLGDGPGQIEALGWQGVLDTPRDPQQGNPLIQRSLALATAEAKRPRGAVAALVDVGRALVEASRFVDARQVYDAIMAIAERTAPGSLEHAHGLQGLGAVAYGQGQLLRAREYTEHALRIREQLAPNSLVVAESLNTLGNVAYRTGDQNGSREYHQRALAIRERLAPHSVDVAASLLNLGNVAFSQGDLIAAGDFYQRALAIREKLAPSSLGAAMAMNNLGLVVSAQGDLNGARDWFARALAIREKLAPDSLNVADSLSSLGSVARSVGELIMAREYYERARTIGEKLAPASLAVAFSLHNLGLVAQEQGDLTGSSAYYELALALKQRFAPGSLTVASTLNNLGNVAFDRGDLGAAADYHQQALAIREKLAPLSLDVAFSLNNIGNVAFDGGDFAAAGDYYRRVLSIRERLAPRSLEAASDLSNLASVAYAQGDLDAAADYNQRALAMAEALAPGSPVVASSLRGLAGVALLRGALADARRYDERALAIDEKLAPDSLTVAIDLHDLAAIAFKAGDRAAATAHATRAWAIVRRQAAVVAGDEARQGFGSKYRAMGSQLIRLLIADGRTDEAFVTLEQGRAQALLQMLAERGVIRRLAPAGAWRRCELAREADNRAGKALENAGTAEARARMALDAEIAQQSQAAVVDDKRRAVGDLERRREEMRQASARARVEADRRCSEVRQAIQTSLPTPLSAAEARRVLPADTVLLAFTIDDDSSTLFVVTRDRPVRAIMLDVRPKELAARVDFVRRSISREAGARGLKLESSDEVQIRAARDLYLRLVPAEAREAVRSAGRVLLSPDGVLWDLPFAALVINDQGKPQYLGLETPLAYAQSLTTFAQPRQGTTPTRPAKEALVVGNPLFDNALRRPPDPGAARQTSRRDAGELAMLSDEGTIYEPLPHAEEEATAVGKIYGVRAAVGAVPTEAWFRQHAPAADVIHLATHGYFNPRLATSSGLRLAVPESAPAVGETNNDGALQAWEVFTQFQLSADLVVLSACNTGRGSKVPGEGLVGLTRAFQVAGASSVVATQWAVSDRSTATGMLALHQNLRKGLPKDLALLRAMLRLANDPATANPFYWAPFVLIGDVRPLRGATRR